MNTNNPKNLPFRGNVINRAGAGNAPGSTAYVNHTTGQTIELFQAQVVQVGPHFALATAVDNAALGKVRVDHHLLNGSGPVQLGDALIIGPLEFLPAGPRAQAAWQTRHMGRNTPQLSSFSARRRYRRFVTVAGTFLERFGRSLQRRPSARRFGWEEGDGKANGERCASLNLGEVDKEEPTSRRFHDLSGTACWPHSEHAQKPTGHHRKADFHCASEARERLTVTQTGNGPFAFAEAAAKGWRGIFLHRKFASPGLQFKIGQHLTALLVQTPRGIQARAIRAN